MSKHLSPNEIARIIEVIHTMKNPISWDKIETTILKKLEIKRSKWGLRENIEIKTAYDAKRKEPKITHPKKKSHPTKTSETIDNLEKDNHKLREQLAIVLGNAIEMGVPIERMERPPTPIDYSSTPGKK
jgi:hypothetical protein